MALAALAVPLAVMVPAQDACGPGAASPPVPVGEWETLPPGWRILEPSPSPSVFDLDAALATSKPGALISADEMFGPKSAISPVPSPVAKRGMRMAVLESDWAFVPPACSASRFFTPLPFLMSELVDLQPLGTTYWWGWIAYAMLYASATAYLFRGRLLRALRRIHEATK